MIKILFRYEIRYTNYDDGETEILLRKFDVISETNKTYLIRYGFNKKRVKKNAYNTYAYDNKKDALNHLIRRSRKRIKWFDFWKKECNNAIKIAEKALNE